MKKVLANNRIRISVTDRCNFRCKYCTNEGQPHNIGNFIELSFVKQLCEFIREKQIYVRKLNITGGEPLLHPELLQIVEVLKTIIDPITLNTNGELLNKTKIIDLKNAGVTCIKFGIDSFFQKTTKPFYKHCNCHPMKIIENLFFARETMPRSSVNMVLTDFNEHEFENILNFCISNKIDLVEFLELINFDFRRNTMPLHSGVKFKTIFQKYSSFFKSITYNVKIAKYICETNDGLIMQFADDFCNSRVCKNLWTRINSTGCLVPCIKSQDKLRINFEDLSDQIEINNNGMCDGPGNKVLRDYRGNLLTEDMKRNYIPSYLKIIQGNNINFSDLDL